MTAAPQTLGGDLRESRLVLSAANGRRRLDRRDQDQRHGHDRRQTGGARGALGQHRLAGAAGQNIPTISRLDRSLMLAVRPARRTASPPASTSRPRAGRKGHAQVKLTRISPDFKTPLTVQAIATELPQGTDDQQ